MTLLTVSDLVVSYRSGRSRREALHGVSFSIDTDEAVLITGQILDTPRWIMVTDRAGGTLHIPHHAIDQIVTCENEEAWDSYRLHADLEDAMGADA